MKLTLTLSALISVASSVLAYPTPAEPFFVSRMVERPVSSSPFRIAATASTCGQFALREPQMLQVRSYNDSTTTYLSVSDDDEGAPILTALPSTNGEQGAYDFDFQTCNNTGFTQGYSRNSGGSMGAPLEFFGRVVTNITTLTSNGTASNQTSQHCLAASPLTANSTAQINRFTFGACNETDSAQWFRLQEGVGGAVLTYFPVRNTTGYVYTGQIPQYFKVDLHRHEKDLNAVEFQQEDSKQYVQFY